MLRALDVTNILKIFNNPKYYLCITVTEVSKRWEILQALGFSVNDDHHKARKTQLPTTITTATNTSWRKLLGKKTTPDELATDGSAP